MFRKNLNLKNIRKFKTLLRNINHECRISRPNTISLTSVSRPSHSHQYFATAALPNYIHNEIKESDIESLKAVTLQDVDKAFLEMDYYIKRTGRCTKNSIENILSMLEKINSASDVHGLYLLRSCGLMHMERPGERVQLANIIWEKLHQLRVQLDVKHFNSLLKILVDCEQQFLPSEFLASMEGSKVEPNKATYLLLMEKYCKDGNLTGAGEILQYLKDKGLPINESVFALLIKGHMRANDISGAEGILEVMRSANLSPSAESYTALACGYAEKGNIDGLKSILANVKDCVTFSNNHFLNIISSFGADTKNLNIIDEILENITDVYNWRPEIANTMISLIHKGCEKDDIAYKLLLKIANPENSFASLFVKTLLICDRPNGYVINYCVEILERGLHDHVFMNAAKAAIDLGKLELSLALFETLQKKGIPVRTSNLNYILKSSFEDEKGMWLALKKMFELGVPAEFYTYFEYVFPAVSVSDPEAVISKIQETGHSIATAVDSLFHFYCCQGEFDNALYLIENYQVNIHPSFSLENYINACRDINNYSKSFLKVLNYLLKNFGLMGGQDPEVAHGINMAALVQKDSSLFQTLLRNQQIRLSRKSLDVCCGVLKRNSPESLKYLRRLRSVRDWPNEKKILTSSITEEEEKLRLLKEKGLPTKQFLLECLSAHLKQRNITRINQLTEELDKEGIPIPPTLLSDLLNFYCQNNDLDKAEKTFKFLKSDCPTFKLDSLKVIRYANLLVRCSKFDDAVNLIKTECQELLLFDFTETSFRRIVRNLLNNAVETGNIDLVTNLQNVLKCVTSSHSQILEGDVLYEPLVKMHLYKNDLDAAINEFEKCVKNHQVAPCLKLLMKKCIVTENTEKLEIVIKIASSLVGKQNVLYDLVAAFLDTGRKSEARKIMENLKDKPYSSHLEDICRQIYNQNRVSDLLELINLVYSVNHMSREKIVHYILKLSSERNDLKTAQDLYNFISKSYIFSDELKEDFSNNLSKNQKLIPNTASKIDVTDFLQFVKEKDVHRALKSFQGLKKGVVRTVEVTDMANFLDLLIKNKILNDFSHDVNGMNFIVDKADEILKPLLEQYSISSDIDSMFEIANIFPDVALKKCSYNHFLAKGYIASEKYEDLLLLLEERWNRKGRLFSVFAFEELLKRPDLEERVVKLAKKYVEDNFDLPISLVWAHYLIQDRCEEADAIYKAYPVSAGKVDILVLKTVRQQENISLGKAYISAINNTDVSKRCKEKTYGTVLDVLVLKEMYDDAAALVVEAQTKDIELEKYYRSTLLTLRNALERENKEVPFSTPSEVTSEKE